MLDEKTCTHPLVHSPDLQFIRYCAEEYGINRGVYNTIDSWFYNHGLQNILKRREMIIEFLNQIVNKKNDRNQKVKFGNGGLTNSLIHFWNQQLISS